VGKASAAVAALLLLVVLAACGSGSDTGETEASTGTTEAASTTSPKTADPNMLANTFEIGPGRELYVECEGTGTPTVRLEAGDESGIEDWHQVMPELADATRTCAYNRAGIGRSVDATGCRQLDDILNDLESLLQVADIAGSSSLPTRNKSSSPVATTCPTTSPTSWSARSSLCSTPHVRAEFGCVRGTATGPSRWQFRVCDGRIQSTLNCWACDPSTSRRSPG
jgi:hypothetical protein